MDLNINKNLKTKVLNNFLNLLAINLADTYLETLKKYKSKDVDELVLNFLDQIVYLVDEEIDITNVKNSSKISKMNTKQKEKFNNALRKDNKYRKMCSVLNFIYRVIKEEETQEQVFNNIYHFYEKSDAETLEIFSNDYKEKEKFDFFKEIKLKLKNSNSFLYKSNLQANI
ncbi:hypothetical protein [Spiroplasma ixodetis]|uniref:hypothetical protein n=1 Tax=Spiroplasma ixodetis TaxID=2141 RepID=UPI002574F805|nr:hypothetical protein [Spiroplasma ixodetis]WJG71009.1 hypothetical protein SIXOD_v1c23200 [Spiroplasma ixodetis Y32]